MDTEPDLLNPEGPGALDKLIAMALRNKAIVIAGLILLIGLGVRAAQSLPIDAVPDVTHVQVQVLTDARGLAPLEVERLVTWPIETALSGLPQTTELRSLSRFGLSVVTVVFEDGTDLWWARQLVAERLVEAVDGIPEGIEAPTLAPPSSGLGEIVQFEVRPAAGFEQDVSLMDLRDVLEWQVAPRLRRVGGVVEVNTFGGELRTYQVEIRPGRLAAHGLVLADVFEALEKNNLTVGGGTLSRGREQMFVQGSARFGSLQDLRDVVVTATAEGTPVLMDSLGTVQFAPMLRQGAVTRDGRGESVIGIAMMGIGENTRTVAVAVTEAIDALRPSLPEGIELDVFYDRTELVERTTRTVGTNLLEGGVLVVAVLLLLLGNLRGGIVVALAIPLSMLFAFIGMGMAGLSGNLMSLGAIDFGLLVDGSVVMIENITRVVGERKAKGLPVTDRIILAASREVARPVALSVGIIILVYLPILALSGVEGRMFRPMALTVVFALVGSLVLALVAMPVLASIFLKSSEEKETRALRLAHRLYKPALTRVLRHPHLTAAVAGLLFVSSLGLAPFLGAQFVPRLDEGSIAIQLVRPASVSLAEAVQQGTEVERTLLEAFPDEVATVVTRTGRPEIATDPMGVDLSDVYVMLLPRSQWTKASDSAELVEAMEHTLDRSVPGLGFGFSQPIELRFNELLEGVRSDVALFVYGEDLDTLDRAGRALLPVLAGIEGAQDAKMEKLAGLPTLRIEVDRTAISRLGLDARDVLDAVETLGGRTAGEVLVGTRRFAVQVRLPPSLRQDIDALGRVLVGHSGGVTVPLAQVAHFIEEQGPLQIGRQDASRRMTLEVNVRGRDVASYVAEAQGRIAEVELPAGVMLGWGGSFENLQAATARLSLLVPLVLLLIFVLLQASFRSVRLTLLVYANVPLAISGGLAALWLRGIPLSISAAVGFIALFGVAVMNGVVLMSCVRDLHKAGASAIEAASLGATQRLRPVLMTAMVAALGFVPMALSSSAGAEVQRPLATVVIGGLMTSTLLTLLVLPALYGRWMREHRW